MKPCPYCAESIQDAAIVCRFCGRDLPVPVLEPPPVPPPPVTALGAPSPPAVIGSRRSLIGMLALGALALVILGNLVLFNPTTPHAAVPKDDSAAAFVMCQKFVRDRLKAPATADFASILSSTTAKLAGDQYAVTSYVDSQNGFGAQIRMKYVCTVSWLGNDRWKLEDLRTE